MLIGNSSKLVIMTTLASHCIHQFWMWCWKFSSHV